MHSDHLRIWDRRLFLVFAVLGVITALLAANFIGWPLNRDITTYGTIARELYEGQWLYVDVWDIKPPAVFTSYLIAQWLVPSPVWQIFLLELLPTLVILASLLAATRAAGFGHRPAIYTALLWTMLSGDIDLQTHEPNTEVFINAFCVPAFAVMLRLQAKPSHWASTAVGLLFAVACMFKTVAIVIAACIGLAHVLVPIVGSNFGSRCRQLATMAAVGAAAIGLMILYYVATGRSYEFYEVMVKAGLGYAGNIRDNLVNGLTWRPIIGEHSSLGLLITVVPFIVLGALCLLDRQRLRAWILLGAYGFSALAAVALPGAFYAHYFQLLLPPVCLAAGCVFGLLEEQATEGQQRGIKLGVALMFLLLVGFESRSYLREPDRILQERYQHLYLVTQNMAHRLADVMSADEVLYQWGEESGLYWYSGKRPTGSIITFPLLFGPQKERLTNNTLQSLRNRPPDLIVAVNYMIDNGEGHPVFEWIKENYSAVPPALSSEAKYFTYYLPQNISDEDIKRLSGQ